MRVTFDPAQLTAERARSTTLIALGRRHVWTRVRQVSFDVERMIKIRMPVDTGRARASWGHSAPPAGPGDGVWIEDEADLSIEQGSNVEYIEKLNSGSSKQAPAGFIDTEEARGANGISELLADDLLRAWG